MGGSRARHPRNRANARARFAARRREDRWAVLALLAVVILVAIGMLKSTPEQREARPWSMPTGSLTPEPGPDREFLPSSGPGTFTFSQEAGPVLGAAGVLKRFRLATESNLDGELQDFSDITDDTLGDERSWVSEKKQRFQRVPENESADFTIALATRDTAYRLCAKAGLDIREDDVPYTSCQANNWVVINLDRWELSVPDYRETGTPLINYRQYVLNHEVGHQLGRQHEPCPAAGLPAPVMQQQTLGLQGCRPNSWPYPNAVT